MELWELFAREAIRDRIARWNACGDAGQVSQMVQVLAPDVEFQVGDDPPLRGRGVVEAYLGGVRGSKPSERPVSDPVPPGPYAKSGHLPTRHFTGTTVIDLHGPERASVRTYYAVLTSYGLDHWGRYLDEFELVGGEWLITKRAITVEGVDPEGWAATFSR